MFTFSISSRLKPLVRSISVLAVAGLFAMAALPVSAQSSDWAIGLDGVDDYGQRGDNSSLSIVNSITVEVWVRPDAAHAGTRQAIVSKRKVATNGGGYELYIDTDGYVRFATFSNTGAVKHVVQSQSQITFGQWNEVVAQLQKDAVTSKMSIGIATYGNSTGSLYTESSPSGASWAPEDGNTPLLIGASLNSSGVRQNFLDGDLDEIRISATWRYGSNVTTFPTSVDLPVDGAVRAFYKFDNIGDQTTDSSTSGNHLTVLNRSESPLGVF